MPETTAAGAAKNLGIVLRGAQGAAEKALDAIAVIAVNELKLILTNPAGSSPGQPPGLRTGGLRLSYRWERGKDVRGRRYVVIGSDAAQVQPVPPRPGAAPQRVVYAPYLEFGTSKMEARPHIRPVFQKIRPLITPTISRAWVNGARVTNAGLS